MSSELNNLLQATAAVLRQAGIGNYQQEAEWIIEHVTGHTRLELYVQSVAAATAVSAAHRAKVEALARRRALGEPLQYLLGTADFFGRLFQVGAGVLVPRPETERLVEMALEHYPGHGRICDLCTGTGVVAITLALELPMPTHIVAVDISPTALDYARRNRELLAAPRLHLAQADLLTAFKPSQQFSMITANPPYIAPDEFAALPADVREHEPQIALIAAEQGLSVLNRIIHTARQHLSPGGWLLCEIGETQGPAVRELCRQAGYASVVINKDWPGRDRVLVAQAKG